MKISKSVILGLVVSSVFAVGAIAADKKENRKPAAACDVSSGGKGITIAGDCADEIATALSNKDAQDGTISCAGRGTNTKCTIATSSAPVDQGAGGR